MQTLSIFWIVGEGKIISGAQTGKPCHFPFLYKGVQYNGCTMKDSTDQPWCASEQEYSVTNFGYCNCPFGKSKRLIILKY